jgi:hypothetical protein
MGERQHICIGYGEREGLCANPAGTPWTPLWCPECDQERRDTITQQMADISAAFREERRDG